LRIEIDAPVVDLHPNEVLIQLLSVTQEGLLGNKLEEPSLLRRVGKVLAFEDPAQFFALLEERDGGRYGSVNRRHLEGFGRLPGTNALPPLATFLRSNRTIALALGKGQCGRSQAFVG
jgi:hypothetical protein